MIIQKWLLAFFALVICAAIPSLGWVHATSAAYEGLVASRVRMLQTSDTNNK
jgi:hypothetical protein